MNTLGQIGRDNDRQSSTVQRLSEKESSKSLVASSWQPVDAHSKGDNQESATSLSAPQKKEDSAASKSEDNQSINPIDELKINDALTSQNINPEVNNNSDEEQ